MARRSARIAKQGRRNYNLANRFGIFNEEIDSDSDSESLQSLSEHSEFDDTQGLDLEQQVVFDQDQLQVLEEVELLDNLLEETHLNLDQEPDRGEVEMVSAAPPEVFETNPFSGNINPSNSNGLKLYQAATAARDEADLLSLKIANATQFIDAMKEDATKFAWGKLTASVEETISVPGTGAKKVKRDVLRDFKHLTVNKVRIHMNKVFESKTPSTNVPTSSLKMFDIDPANDTDDKDTFYLRVRANMIGLRILASLDKTSVKSLKMKEELYLWENNNGEKFYDGPTMLQICIEKVNPSTRVGVSQLKESLRSIKAATFGHNVRDLTDKMDSTYRDIIQRGSTHDDYVMDLFNALLTCKNSIFNAYIQREKDKWDTGMDIDPDSLISDAVTKYNNMVAKKEWKQVEAPNSKIAALTTQLNELQEKFALVTKEKAGNNSCQGGSQSGLSRERDFQMVE